MHGPVPAHGFRVARPGDADAVAAIYNHYVATSTATFELSPVGADAMAARMAEVASHGLPWLVAEHDGAIARETGRKFGQWIDVAYWELRLPVAG